MRRSIKEKLHYKRAFDKSPNGPRFFEIGMGGIYSPRKNKGTKGKERGMKSTTHIQDRAIAYFED
jgi:hypothetical protein